MESCSRALRGCVDSFPDGAILLAAPKTGDAYYRGMESELHGLFARVVAAAHPGDKFIIACDKQCAQKLRGMGVPDSAILVSGLPDIWARDICPVVSPNGYFNFRYLPTYLKPADARFFERKFTAFLVKSGVKSSHVSLILDGGNYCHNGVDKAVVCDTVLYENRGMSRERLIDILEPVTGSRSIAVVPTEKGDTLGHADGMVSWLAPDVLAINQFDEPFHSKVVQELQQVFPGVRLEVVPYEPTDRLWKGIADAAGVYTNILHTPNAAYMLNYGTSADSEAKAGVEKHLTRPVITVNGGKAPRLGGGLRCLTWQRRSTNWTIPL